MRMRVAGGVLAALLAAGCAQESSTMTTEPDVIAIPLFTVDAENFRTHLQGDNEVPPNASEAQGQAIFMLSDDGTELHYKLIVANIENVAQAHIHRAPAGVNGGIVAWLYPPAPPAQLIPGRSDGILAEGVITDAQVIGSLAGTGVAGLLAQIRAGNTYANVHTLQFPGGEVRGQVH
jgi:hypothetical protein